MTKEEFKARVSVSYGDPLTWEEFLEAVWQLHLLASNHWIPVEERLPPRAENSFIFSDYVLVCDNIGYMDTACYNFEKNRWDWLNNVTHWMPLPKPPKKGK